MKKFVSIIVALVLVLSMTTASASVVSKTSTDNTQVKEVESMTEGVVIEETFSVTVAPDAAPVVEEITALFQFVNNAEEKQAPIAYFSEETQEQIKAVLTAKLEENVVLEEVINLEEMELNEFVTIEVNEYKEEYGDIKATFTFVTEYTAEQKIVALVSLFNGEVDENGKQIVEWIVLDAEVLEDGTVAVTIPAVEMEKIQAAQNVALAILSEKAAEEEILLAE